MATSMMNGATTSNGDSSIPSSIHTTMSSPAGNAINKHGDLDEMSTRLHQEALAAMEDEPELTYLLQNTVLAPGVRTFEEAVASTITYRLLLRPCQTNGASNKTNTTTSTPALPTPSPTPSPPSAMMFCPNSLRGIISKALHSDTDDPVVITEAGHTMAEAVRKDVLAVVERDPAVDSLLEVVLFLKGFAALVCHRAAYYKWHTAVSIGGDKKKKSLTALWLQSQASAVFGLDIHPAATIGAGVLMDHGTGIVIGETATIGDNCTLLHGVTLGGTGKDGNKDRHPKVGADVLIGAGASLLGNIRVGDGAKIGAGSIVLGPIPSGATAVGAPAKIIGRAKEAKPASTMDEGLQQVSMLHKSASSSTVATASTTTQTTTTGTVSVATKQDSIAEEDDKNTGWSDSDNNSNIDEKSNNLMEDDSADHTDHPSCCCPFRDFVNLAKSAPKGSITICILRHMLNPEGCSSSDIGEVLFALDTRNVGYIKPDVFFNDTTTALLTDKAMLSPERAKQVMAEFKEQWTKQQLLLKA